MKLYVLIAVMLVMATPLIFSQTQKVENNAPEVASKPDTDGQKGALKTDDNTGGVPQQKDYVRPDSKIRFKRYAMSIVGPMALGEDVVKAGWSTWRNSPEEWGDHWDGFGRRVASSFGKAVISNTISYGLDESFKLDSHYYRSKDKSFRARIGNALISPVTARNKDGDRVFGFPHIVGIYTAHIVAVETWYPARYGWKDGLKSGTYSIGLEAAFNLVKEFIWKK